ncbi:MAG: DUF928 domain-containing protein [Merismopedia sp. SIO2A8]|nr:DUF928 domain-containing protein [Merismopedia sp. SIO2A8]
MSKQIVPHKVVVVALIAASALGAFPILSAAAVDRIVQPEMQESSEQRSDGQRSDETLVAGLSFRLRVRPSRWRFGGFARACATNSEAIDVNNLRQVLAPVAPPTQANEGTAEDNSPVDQTVESHPTILVRVPDLPGATITFTLQDEGLPGEGPTEELYATGFQLTGEEKGIIGIQIPSTAPSLEVGQKYAWQVLLSSSCGPNSGEFRISTGSWLERVAFDRSLAGVDQMPMRDRPALYAAAGIWQETVSTLAQLRYQNPADVEMNESWSSVMQSVDLGELASDPILQIHAE